MHELAVTQEIVKTLIEECKKNNIRILKKATIIVGSFTTYKKHPIEYYFEMLKKEHELLKNSELEVEEVQARMKCLNCRKTSTLYENSFILCPLCDSADIEIIEGKDLYIKHIYF